MKKLINNKLPALVASAVALLSLAAQGAHEANNKAAMDGEGTIATGKAIVNYVKGKDTWNASVLVKDLPEGVYFFVVRANTPGGIGEYQPVCMLESDGKGNASGSASQFDLGGFHEGLIVDMDGNVLISGFFERRGGNREG
ncbi:hypothetical protein HAHE_29420 [Haloferula helveola]|uniref:Uncharacterized protein n=1 Tax=Haloferula helveola TaxID=490095 RepID=A0ABM7REN0_9BACT|nr:hypothetical protein HAHE_29420 [Haloferula helveola]